MDRNVFKIVFSNRNFAAGNVLKQSLLRIPALAFPQLMKYGCSPEDNHPPKKKSSPLGSKDECKPEPCPPKPCKEPRYACPPNDPPDHCPYKPPKCKKPCDPRPKQCE